MTESLEELPGQRRRERLVLVILGAVQFTTIVDFMIVMPLGPQLMRSFSILPAQFGLIVSSYTFAAGVAGLVASAIIDRFARRAAFMTLFLGFLLGTLLCAFAPSYPLLTIARVVTGAFGGILGGMSLTIVGDVFPENRRGRATGSLMAGFSLASIAGVPFGLMLGTKYGWQIPFIVLVAIGLPVLALTPLALPRLEAHTRAHSHPLRAVAETFSHRNHLHAFALMIALMFGSFTVFPYLATYLVYNAGMSEEQLPIVYVVGGVLTLVASPIIGKLADRFGKLRMFRIICPLSAVIFAGITHLPRVPVAVAVALFASLMVCNVGRMISAMAMITSSVVAHGRGGFMSANASVQHIACGVAAYVGGLIVTQETDGRIEHFGTVGWIAAASSLLSLWLAGNVRIADDGSVSAAKISLAAAAEASTDSGEPLLSAAAE